MAYPVYEDSGATAYLYGNYTFNVPYPATVNANDILFALIFRRYYAGSQTFSAVSGWTLLGEIASGPSIGEMAVYWRRADGTESGTQTFTWTGAFSYQYNWAVMHRFSGCITSGSPFDDTDNSGGNDTSVEIPAMTCAGSERLAISLGGANTLTAVNNDATNYTRAAQPSNTGGVDCVFPVFTQQVASSGTVAADSYTKADVSNDEWAQLSAILIPAAVTPTGYTNKVIVVASANIGKVNGVATANISKVNGV